MDYIDLPPNAPMLVESTRAIGYTLEAALADIIDNSISAGARKVEVGYFPKIKPYIAILDDGEGMSSERLTEAMRYGSSDPNLIRDKNDMGRFGLGMKTASLSQCRCLTVISKRKEIFSARQWDLDFIKKTSKWSLKCLSEANIEGYPFIENLKKQKSGTIVVWHELDKIFIGSIDESVMATKMQIVNDHLALVFHRYLKGGDAEKRISIHMNGVEIEGFDPFIQSKSRSTMAEERIEIPEPKSTVVIQPFTLPHHSKLTQQEIDKYGLRNMQGFYIYRNKRLLKWGTWFRMARLDELSKLARVRVDIPNTLDDLWTLDVKKSTATPPEFIKIRLRQIINKILDSSKRTYTFREKKETNNTVIHIWSVYETREGIRYKVNKEHPLYEKLIELIDDDAKHLLDKYIYAVAENFPINKFQVDLSNEKKFAKDDHDKEFDEVKELISIYLRYTVNEEEINAIVERLLQTEPFCHHIEKIWQLVRGR